MGDYAYYLLTLLNVFGIAVNFIIIKLYQKNGGNGLWANLIYIAYSGAFKAILFFFINGCKFEITPFSAITAVIFSLSLVGYTLIGFKIISVGSVSLYTLFLMIGGMLLPYFYGLFFLGEEISLLRIIGIIIIIIAMVISAADLRLRAGKVYILLCCAVFLLNGMVSVSSKMQSVRGAFTPGMYETVSSPAFTMLIGISNYFLASFALLYMTTRHKKAEGQKIVLGGKLLLLTALSTATSGLSFLVQLIVAGKLPATVQFPMITGGTIIMTAILGMLFLREKPNIKSIVGVVMCLCGTLLFL